MDADTIRLILIVVGALLILALYLWERSRHERDEDDDYEETDAPYGLGTGKREPRLPRHKKDGATDPGSKGHAAGGRRSDPDPGSDATEPDGDDGVAVGGSDGREPLLIQLSVSARREPFEGVDLMDAAESCGLRPGRMEIFHCLDEFDDHTRIYFSMANMVKPGTFPFDAMEGFTTPGLMLFAQLEGRPEDITVLEEMIATARKLAVELGGEVLDETRRPLTVRKEESLREAILDNERRWARASER